MSVLSELIKLGLYPLSVRRRLTADRAFYVRTDGNDANSGLANTAQGAFATIQAALNAAAQLDLGLHNVTINVGAGTYTGAINVSVPFISSGGTVTLAGDTVTPGNVVLNVAGNAITVGGPGSVLSVQGFKIITSGGGACLLAINGGLIKVSGAMEYGAAAGGAHMQATGAGSSIVSLSGNNYAISGGAAYHMLALQGGQITNDNKTVTLTGTPAISGSFAYAGTGGGIQGYGVTWTGAATGIRYTSVTAGGIDSGGAGANYFPGSVAGAATAPGWYV